MEKSDSEDQNGTAQKSLEGSSASDRVENGRRSFLKLATGALALLTGVVIGAPIVLNLIGPIYRRRKLSWAKAGRIGLLPEGNPVRLTFAIQTKDAYISKTEMHDVWTIKHSPERITVFSPICPHLGCEYNWDPKTGHFECPCHGSVFALDGKVLAGPAPRPLDRLPTKIKNEELYVEWERFKIGIPQKIAV
jgi:menaquinol-cytochrome c reductase iron-sulfur subunit